MKVIALDFGEKRIGVAVSDPTGLLATPLTTIERAADQQAIEAVLRLAEEYEADHIVVGMPLSMSGRTGPQARLTAEFVRSLKEQTSLPVSAVDERLSSVQAERMLKESGVEPSREKGRIDAAAAAVILQSYLDSRRPSPPD